MACEQGRIIHDGFDHAVTARINAEIHSDEVPFIESAKAKESAALKLRARHVRDCPACYQDPPRTQRVIV
jgi:hypothetical protein